MKLLKLSICTALLLVLCATAAYAASAVPSGGSKRLDLSRWHNVGNIWLRVSNYGFFGSGDDVVPQYPSLEYPGGSGIDYLYQGALWFGAKKYRRNAAGRRLYWVAQNPSADSSAVIAENDPGWHAGLRPVIDTLTTVGFDGDKDLYEFLPAYNPLVTGNAAVQDLYNLYNPNDETATASTRQQRRGLDDDGDGIIDEDFVGYSFPLRTASELPVVFQSFGGLHLFQTNNYNIVSDGLNNEIWFPLGFMDLSKKQHPSHPYAFTYPYDDDSDGLIDEDGAPVSEQDYISFYYDYCPLGTVGDRDLGISRSQNTHVPLSVSVRQMSYQWSFDYIRNLVYVEFNITNMNIASQDTLFDCAMGIYMDCDVGPQTWGPEKASDDVSGYVKGTGYEFAYTRDHDYDGGLSPGIVGSRVCTPDPEQLKFHCWFWNVGDGPDDFRPQNMSFAPRKTANEKYWLLTGKNPNDIKFQPLRPEQDDVMEYEQPSPDDTRFLFAFYGAQPGTADYDDPDKRWHLAPGKTMKIVIAVFPGDNKEELKRTARWAKEIYGQAQTLTTVILPDTFPHYNPPEPPEIPRLYAEMVDDGARIDMYWDNRSEFSYDTKTVSTAIIGWQDPSVLIYPGIDSDPTWIDWASWDTSLDQFKPNGVYNNNALVNPLTAWRLRHDFQGYTIWGRSGSGSQEDWEMVERWDKIDTAVDLADYSTNNHVDSLFTSFGGYLGINKGLPNPNQWITTADYTKFYKLDENYLPVPVTSGDTFCGFPIYNPDVNWSQALQAQAAQIAVDNPLLTLSEIRILQARLFAHPSIRLEIFDQLFDSKMIPLPGHGGQVAIPTDPNDTEDLEELRKQRLARRYYTGSIHNPRRGIEYYVAATAYDRGIPANDLDYLETGRDADANMIVFFPGALARENMNDIYVVPNPYIGSGKFDGRRDQDRTGDKSRRLWFVNLPARCVIRIYTLAGDLVKEINHDGAYDEDIITVSKAAYLGIAASGIHSWNLLSMNNQIIAPGVYLYSVENKTDGKLKVGKFVIIK
ncbi:MAG: hypothetical protein FJ042_01625 [Candidatus Cloacimonetes bacterium]|nr:hypothetical protein [Candidatus Cloacimonadota bacterium]